MLNQIAFLVSFPVIADMTAGTGGSVAGFQTVESFAADFYDDWNPHGGSGISAAGH